MAALKGREILWPYVVIGFPSFLNGGSLVPDPDNGDKLKGIPKVAQIVSANEPGFANQPESVE